MQQAERIKKPNSVWWSKTLKPLRAKEVAATKAHLAKSAQPVSDKPGTGEAGPSKPAPKFARLPAFSAPKPPQPLAKLKQEVSRVCIFGEQED